MKYKEILRLKEMLETANIPFEYTENLFGNLELAYAIRIGNLCDAVEHSYGNNADKLEIMGALTIEEQQYDSVKGHLTAEEVFKRFKYCYENNTSTYSTDIPEVEVGDIIRDNDNTCYQVKNITSYNEIVIDRTDILIPIKNIISVYRYDGKDFKLVWQKAEGK